jgi:ABC-type transport system involved in multi-copper enzyme maturation permease subunit
MKAIQEKNQQVDELIYNKGVYADLPPQPLSIFVGGLEESLPSQVHMAWFSQRKIDENFYHNPLFALFATPDYSYVVNIVVSLLALLFVFDAICGEKERGTLKLVLANSVPRDLIVLGKWIGGFISLIAPFLVALLTGIAYVYLTGAILFNGEILSRLLWLVGTSLLYISLFFTLGLMISTLTHRPATALIVSLFVWICWILVIPNLAPVIARILYPVPSVQKITAEKLAVDQETNLQMQRVSQTMLNYGNKAQQTMDKIRAKGESRKKKLDLFFQGESNTQIDLSKTLSRLSPASSFRYASTELAHTGVGLFAGFKTAYRRFQENFAEFAEGIDNQRDNNELSDQWFQLDAIPKFKFPVSRLDDTLNGIFVDLLLLGIYNVIFFLGAYVFFLRYDAT